MSLPADQMLAAFPGALSPRAVPVSVPTQESWTSDSNQARLPRPSPSLSPWPRISPQAKNSQDLWSSSSTQPPKTRLSHTATPIHHPVRVPFPSTPPTHLPPTHLHSYAPQRLARERLFVRSQGLEGLRQGCFPYCFSCCSEFTALQSFYFNERILLHENNGHVGLQVGEIKKKNFLFIPTIPSMTKTGKANK